jgi:hypothetical protein
MRVIYAAPTRNSASEFRYRTTVATPRIRPSQPAINMAEDHKDAAGFALFERTNNAFFPRQPQPLSRLAQALLMEVRNSMRRKGSSRHRACSLSDKLVAGQADVNVVQSRLARTSYPGTPLGEDPDI